MLHEAVQGALNDQLANEQASAHQYLAMAAWCERKSFTGAAAWMRAQSDEERGHALKLFQHILDCGGEVVLQAIEAPRASFSSLLEVFETSLAQEQQVTQRIHALFELAQQEKDYPTQVMLQWFITEQVEEEASVSTIVERLRLAGDDRTALLLIDRELGERRAG